MTLMEQELFILLELLSSPPGFYCGRVAESLVFCVVFCRSSFVFFLPFFFWSVLLRITASDYTFGINSYYILVFVTRINLQNNGEWIIQHLRLWSKHKGMKENEIHVYYWYEDGINSNFNQAYAKLFNQQKLFYQLYK